jgi:F0F1-type ATP synthase membrane subunit b/b'
MPQFDASKYFSLIFWFFVCFSYLIYFIKNKLIPKMDNALQERFFKIEKEKTKIETIKKEIEEISRSQSLKIQTAQLEVDDLIDKAKKEIDRDKQEKLERLELETQDRILEFDHELKWQIQEIKHQFERDLASYLDDLKKKIIAEK